MRRFTDLRQTAPKQEGYLADPCWTGYPARSSWSDTPTVVCRSPRWLRLVRMSPTWSMCARSRCPPARACSTFSVDSRTSGGSSPKTARASCPITRARSSSASAPNCGERRDRETASAFGALGSRPAARGRIRGETRNVRDQRAGRDPPRKRGRRGSRTRAGHDHFPGLRPPPDAQPPRRAGSHLGRNRRANRPRGTGRVLIRRFPLTRRAGTDARGQARYGADLQGVGDSWSRTG